MVQNIKQKVLNDFLIRFGKNVAKIRKEKKMTQSEIAHKCNTDAATVSKFERGLFNIKISSLLILANGLDVGMDELFSFPGINECISGIFTETEEPYIINK